MPTQSNYDRVIPKGTFYGDRAMSVQFYDESNRKRGLQWEASRRIPNVASGAKLYSCIKLGTNPIDLKARVLGYTGDGVLGDMYIMPEGSNLTGALTPDPVQNLLDEETILNNAGTPTFRDFELYTLTVAPDLTNAVKFGSTLILEGATSNQAKGHIPIPTGQGKVLSLPNREYVFEITSIGPSNQNISSHIILYNGPLDLPLGKYF